MNKLIEAKAELINLEKSLALTKNLLSDKESERDNLELDCDDFIDSYEEMLNECNGEFMGMDASYILKECDPTAYRCGLIDYVDNEDVAECEEYKAMQEEVEELESEIESLEFDIDVLESEIEALEEDEECALCSHY